MGIPKTERRWETIRGDDGKIAYMVTSKQDRSVYFLYQNIDGELKKLGKSDNPLTLKQKYIKP